MKSTKSDNFKFRKFSFYHSTEMWNSILELIGKYISHFFILSMPFRIELHSEIIKDRQNRKNY